MNTLKSNTIHFVLIAGILIVGIFMAFHHKTEFIFTGFFLIVLGIVYLLIVAWVNRDQLHPHGHSTSLTRERIKRHSARR